MNRRQLIRVSLGAGIALTGVPALPGETGEDGALLTLPRHREGMEFIRGGGLGRLRMVRAFARAGAGGADEELEPVGAWGAYWLQQAQLVSGEREPLTVLSVASVTTFRFPSFTAVCERGAGDDGKPETGCCFYGEGGIVSMDLSAGWSYRPADPEVPGSDAGEAGAAVLDALQARRGPGEAAALENGYLLARLARLSRDLGRSVRWDAERGTLAGGPEIRRAWDELRSRA